MKQTAQHHAGTDVKATTQSQNRAIADDERRIRILRPQRQCPCAERKCEIDANNFQRMLARHVSIQSR